MATHTDNELRLKTILNTINYFDTNMGGKRNSDTYSLITKELTLPSNRILFLSDVTEELVAADKAGMKTVQITREGNIQSWKQSA